ncbi:unnamed protein product [Sphagnum jensenii]|uniref:Photosystem I subunit VII n=1 Tax=Sphagnum jensenii TaxID=128206 RepID=A0ABP1B5U7_9BRYO
MTFYKGLPLIGKDMPTIEPTGTIVENVSCSSINLNCICICFWCSSKWHCRGLFCGQLMQLGPCMGYKSGHHSLQSMLF